MAFQQKHTITKQYLSANSKRRSGSKMQPGVKFIVAHDTGNPNSTAAGNVNYYQESRNEIYASAHLFVDDKDIIECIPALTGDPEKAWHVLYGVPTDDKLFGHNANDAAIGVEYCYGSNIDADEAYRKYIWVMAYACNQFNLDPAASIVGHFFLDPARKSDPVTGLARSRRTYEQLLRDIVSEYNVCNGSPLPAYNFIPQPGSVTAVARLNIRQNDPSTRAPVVRKASIGESLAVIGYVSDGENINGNSKWFKDQNGNYFWSGGCL